MKKMVFDAIIVVEGDKELRTQIKNILDAEEYPVVVAANGQDALDCLKTVDHPCLLLVDLTMPLMDGREFLESVEFQGQTSKIKHDIIVMSEAFNVQKTSQEMGAAFLKKPFNLEVLLDMVRDKKNN
jgi:CheY-like chemotaxis protein